MMLKAIVTVSAAVLIAACSKSADQPADNAATAAEAPPARIVPGLYRQATVLLDLKDSSLSPEEAAAAAKAIGTTQTAERCVTPDMVADPEKLVREDTDPNCTVEKSQWSNGHIDFALTCPESDDVSAGSLRLTGVYGKDSYRFELHAKGAGDDRMAMRVDAERLGDCPA